MTKNSVRWMVVFCHSDGGSRQEPDFPEVEFWHPTKEASMEEGTRVLQELNERGDTRDWRAVGYPDPFKVGPGEAPGEQWIQPAPPPKAFDPNRIPKMDLTEEKRESFDRSIRESRRQYGTIDDSRSVEVKRDVQSKRARPDETEALLHGWLREVNWDQCTAQLHRREPTYVRLRFDESLADDMLRFATQYVEVRGRGRIDEHDRWGTVLVEKISGTRSCREPFDKESFLNDPSPRIFDSAKIVTASEPFDVEEFNRVVREGRDVHREGYQR